MLKDYANYLNKMESYLIQNKVDGLLDEYNSDNSYVNLLKKSQHLQQLYWYYEVLAFGNSPYKLSNMPFTLGVSGQTNLDKYIASEYLLYRHNKEDISLEEDAKESVELLQQSSQEVVFELSPIEELEKSEESTVTTEETEKENDEEGSIPAIISFEVHKEDLVVEDALKDDEYPSDEYPSDEGMQDSEQKEYENSEADDKSIVSYTEDLSDSKEEELTVKENGSSTSTQEHIEPVDLWDDMVENEDYFKTDAVSSVESMNTLPTYADPWPDIVVDHTEEIVSDDVPSFENFSNMTYTPDERRTVNTVVRPPSMKNKNLEFADTPIEEAVNFSENVVKFYYTVKNWIKDHW